MRQIYPDGGDDRAGDHRVDLAVAYAYPPDATPPGRGGGHVRQGSWVRANMVASADGAATLTNVSGALSSEDDRELFAVLRGLADVIVVGAQTVRAEGYGPARARQGLGGLRAGRPPTPPIAVVTGKINLDLSSPLFTAAPPHARTIVLTSGSAPTDRRNDAGQVADVVVAGSRRVDLGEAINALAERGHRRVLTEGGPRLLGELATARLLDELCLTVSPLLVGGYATRIIAGPEEMTSPSPLRLAHVLEADGTLFCRYVRLTQRQ